MKYRLEIDGLRAVAVIPVILFHAGFSLFSGGFVGVDIFFVISGYLITTIILTELDQGVFSLSRFYERRIRRIFPCLFLVMAACFIGSWYWLLPTDMQAFSLSMSAVSTFTSNIFFWQDTGYWGAENELKPLLHTWSIAIEEQYYFLFPLFLMMMLRFGKITLLVIMFILALMSLAFAEFLTSIDRMASFFLLPSRAWELIFGAIIATFFIYQPKTMAELTSNGLVNQLGSISGFGLITYSIFMFDSKTPFPGLYTLVPTIGAGLVIIFALPATVVGKMLASRMLVGVGLISYSMYLWHQPIFAFARYKSLEELSTAYLLLLIAIMVSFSYISWFYVERPLRNRNFLSKKMIFVSAFVLSTLFLSIGLVGYWSSGFAGFAMKNSLVAQGIEKKLRINFGLSNKCEESFTLSSRCRTSDEPKILLWGDSFAMHLAQGIRASNPDVEMIQMTKSACGPFFDVAPVSSPGRMSWARNCLQFTNEVRSWLRSNDTVKYVVVSSPFWHYLSDNHKLLYINGEVKAASKELALQAFIRTLDQIKALGYIPVVFSPPPANGVNLGRCSANAFQQGLKLSACNFALDELTSVRRDVYEFLDSIAKKHRVIRLDKLLCAGGECKTHLGSTWLFNDERHLSHLGSAALGKQFDWYKMLVNDQ